MKLVRSSVLAGVALLLLGAPPTGAQPMSAASGVTALRPHLVQTQSPEWRDDYDRDVQPPDEPRDEEALRDENETWDEGPDVAEVVPYPYYEDDDERAYSPDCQYGTLPGHLRNC